MRYIRRLLPYVRPHWKLAILSVAITILSSLAALLGPWPLTIVVDSVLGDKPLAAPLAGVLGSVAADRTTLLLLAVSAGLFVTLVGGALDVLANYVNTRMNQQIVLAFRTDLFHHTERLAIPFADQVSTGRLMYAINLEAAASGGVIMAAEPLARGLYTIVGMIWISFHIDPLLALLSVVVVPPLYYSVGFYARHIQGRLMAVKGMEGDSLSIVHDAMSMLRVIVAFVRETHEVHRFRNQGAQTVAARVDVTVRQATFGLVVGLITALGNALVLGVGALHVLQGQITAGELLVVLSYTAAVYKPLHDISHTISALQEQFVSLQMGFQVLDEQPAVEDRPHATDIGRAEGRVTFEHVHFSYPGRAETLNDISFDAPAGSIVAIVGPTGAGKTTLASLLPRFYQPAGGHIRIDGIDIQDLTMASLRRQISLVPQEPMLFSGTIADNIRYGRLEASIDDIIEAARQANAHDFIMGLPQQYDTAVGEKGARLSGGERQRICVARAFLKDAPILILDEPTASIDSRTEAVILDALDRLMAGRTTFMIAHRLSTIRSADLLLVLDHGELAEQGSPHELLGRGGLYSQLYRAQHAQHRTAFSVDWLAHAVPPEMEPGAEHHIAVTVSNTGTRAWPAVDGPHAPAIAISYHWISQTDDEIVVWDGLRTPLPHAVAPGATCVAENIVVVAPAAPGSYELQVSLLQEGVAWFEQLGAAPLSVPVNVRPNAVGKAAPSDAPTDRAPPAIARRPQIVLLGILAKTPVAGVVWQTLHYLVGFERLGYEVTYLEGHAVHPPMFRDSLAAAQFIGETMQRVDLQNQWAFQALHEDGTCYGLTETQLRERCNSAALIINLHGATAPLAEHRSGGPLVYLETDPVAMQVDLYHNCQPAIDFLEQHDAFFTFGENYGRADCKLPVSDRFAFKPTRQPIVMDFWPPSGNGTRDVLTTVASWKQSERHADVQLGEHTYSWSKHVEFLKFLDLPRRTDQPFELALAKCDQADESLLREYGWQVRDALSFSLDPDSYRHYIGDSRGEFTVAKDQNIRLRSGWFSDRSATYLAAGRPVITQDTGFGNVLPTGDGLFSFENADDVLEAVESINADYARHRRAAHDVATEYFNSDVVLKRLLADVGQ